MRQRGKEARKQRSGEAGGQENSCFARRELCECVNADDFRGGASGRDGAVQCYQPYGREGLLVADVDLDVATGMLAKRCKYASE